MRRSFKVTGAFAAGATILVLVLIFGGFDSLLDPPTGELSLSDKMLFFGCFWPAILGQRFFPHIDGFFFIVVGWALIGFIVGGLWWKLSSHGHTPV